MKSRMHHDCFFDFYECILYAPAEVLEALAVVLVAGACSSKTSLRILQSSTTLLRFGCPYSLSFWCEIALCSTVSADSVGSKLHTVASEVKGSATPARLTFGDSAANAAAFSLC